MGPVQKSQTTSGVAKCADLYCLRAVLYLLRKINFLENILHHQSIEREGRDQKSKLSVIEINEG